MSHNREDITISEGELINAWVFQPVLDNKISSLIVMLMSWMTLLLILL